ncbi:MAG: hypothetical protein C0392_10055 [Syntrophus sp. (in: bacteria)]|nr:hypothetical protein [Syntrophus sp. (in: bacteria)]
MAGMTKEDRNVLIRDLAIFWFLVFLVILVWKNNILVLLVLMGTYCVRYFLWPNNEDHVVFISGAVMGTIAEIIATKVGIWSYTMPTFFNIPLWLPCAWGVISVLIIRIAQALLKKQV